MQRTANGKSNLLGKITLDILLIAVLITLYSKNVISLMYHEIAGLALAGLFILHLVFNRKWIASTARKIRQRKLPARTRALSLVNVLLAASWLAVVITGILISKKLFPFQLSFLTPWHFFASALALVMTGIHFGLHWNYFWGFVGKRVALPRVLAVVLAVCVAGFGAFEVFHSSFGKWISAPFTAQGEHEHGSREGGENLPADSAEHANEESDGWNQDAALTEGVQSQASTQRGGHEQQPFSLANLLSIIAMGFSILFLFSALTHGIELLTIKRKAGKQ